MQVFEGSVPSKKKQKKKRSYKMYYERDYSDSSDFEVPLHIEPIGHKAVMQKLSWLYDLLNALISVADLITDVSVTYQFYVKGRKVYFVLASTILTLTHICYAVAFILRYARDAERRGTREREKKRVSEMTPKKKNKAKTFCFQLFLILSLLPFSPLIPFAFYWFSVSKDSVSTFLYQKFHLFVDRRDDTYWTDNTTDTWVRWGAETILSNMGFIIEAMIQSIPQAILQSIAICHYHETNNLLAICSIAVSLSSIGIKSLVFTFGIDCTTRLLKWICFVADFFGLFASIGWCFWYDPSADYWQGSLISSSEYRWWRLEHWLHSNVTWFGYLYLYKVVFTTCPLALLSAMAMSWLWIGVVYEDIAPRQGAPLLRNACSLLFILPIVVVAFGISSVFIFLLFTLCLEVALFSWIPFFFAVYRHAFFFFLFL
ncbi:hypothetical protein RFI_30787 [Reticulomyxa filosa]|uniref:XK-related protein n=1 Tax=Reticulomyxa filosa TaxID=46433 RepID=X6LYA1_RETFI|nr:hypothetical protein RFI_30787 [Reticulomyxa filosa]|eukprot:ETO06604.1 hypothetical protein RFI_30787 [Reticulomyxa filosa]